MSWILTIENQGPASADDLTISINGLPLDRSPLIDPQELDEARFKRVDGHGRLRIPLRTSERPKAVQVELTWSDPSGELGLHKAKLD